jgi:hypothetical protein
MIRPTFSTEEQYPAVEESLYSAGDRVIRIGDVAVELREEAKGREAEKKDQSPTP